jgi:hypothetical protein
MNYFTSAEVTEFSIGDQKGANIKISTESGELEIKAWVDYDEVYNLRTEIEGHDGFDMVIQVDKSDHITPKITYSDDKKYCYVAFKSNSLHIHIADEGVILDVWDCNDDQDGSVESTYIYFDEIAEQA